MKDARLIGIAQYAIGRPPERLCCLGLGSCVAVFIYDPDTKIGGVLHALLPRKPAKKDPDPKYTDSGIKILYDEIVSKGAKKRKLIAKLVGGAQMFPNLDLGISDIGTENIREARKTLQSLGVEVVSEEVKGNKGRSAYYSLETGDVTIRTAFSADKVI
ncbi:TPA: chemotaxis protein CheD [Thermoplasmata archaeon]|nr:chemotaxis protein CheD [Thermoplasmata archaeon]